MSDLDHPSSVEPAGTAGAAEPEAKPSAITGAVQYDSPELACLHEAGHAAAAFLVGAKVKYMILHKDATRSYGQAGIERDAAQSLKIAVGGLAVEYLLWQAGRLRLKDGTVPTETQLHALSVGGNASADKISYFGGDYAQPNGAWPAHKDLIFMKAAGLLSKRLDMKLIERLAGALLAEERLEEAHILALLKSDEPSATTG